jgi:hypothetical protein
MRKTEKHFKNRYDHLACCPFGVGKSKYRAKPPTSPSFPLQSLSDRSSQSLQSVLSTVNNRTAIKITAVTRKGIVLI